MRIRYTLASALAITAACVSFTFTGCSATHADPVAASQPAPSDRILIFGGGPSPRYSQASLEQNVLYLRRVLAILARSAVPQDVFFNDGVPASRTVEARLPAAPSTTPREWIAEVMGGSGSDVQLLFRKPLISNIEGPNTAAAITHWFTTAGPRLQPNDRLMVYFTGHGGPLREPGPGNRNTPSNRTPARGSTLSMWPNAELTTKEFITDLDKIHPDVNVTLVMVQCFSGGFANVIYNGGDPANGLSKAHRCGFFSTISTRMAAGCTPDIDKDDYEEFSTAFFAALCGQTRGGKHIERPDYDHNGITTFDEAFTYALLTLDTIDIPMTTSDQLLRDESRPARDTMADADLLPNTAPYSTILAAATPSQKAAMEGLSDQLSLTGEDRIAAARRLAASINNQRNALTREMRQDDANANMYRIKIHDALVERWPELGITWHPMRDKLIDSQGAEMLAFIQQQTAFKAWSEALTKSDDAEARDFALEKKWVKTQRLINRAEVVILAANLPKMAKPNVLQAYEQLTAMENGTLSDWKAQR